jgi:CubicO group peptidase (beta-lactamase class C family)
MKRILPAFLSLLLAPLYFAAAQEEKPKAAQSIPELQQQIEKILKDTHTPGTSIAIVHRDGPEWIAGLGIADVASGRAANADTLFRIGSTSKAFTSLSVLLLADQGKLSLNDTVHKLAPDLWFDNRWEATDPIRVVNLLEHTTGWDDMHLREYVKDAGDMTLREALAYDHHSRISRWPPNTRSSYCNSGPPAAAYIIEKITGQRFEDFVQQNLFNPIGMKTATFFRPKPGTETTLYHTDGKTAYPYWNIMYRPAGSINASAKDMAAYVQFYLNRGAVNGTQVVPSADIDRMENPASTWAAKEGLKNGYGLSNYWSIHDGFVYHGHNGGVNGGLTDMAYMPDQGVGYFVSINSANLGGAMKIVDAVRAYITAKLQRPEVPVAAPLPSNAADYEGWYEPDSPRVEQLHFMERLAGITHVRFENGQMVVGGLLGGTENFVPVTGMQFRHVPKKDPPEPVAGAILLAPNDEGLFIEVGQTLKRIPVWMLVFEIVGAAFFLIAMVAILVYAPFWILGGLSPARRRPAERAMRLWPLIAVLSLIAFLVIFNATSEDTLFMLGQVTFWSVSLFLSTLVFAAAVLASILALWRAPKEGVRRGVRRFSALVTCALVIGALYFAYWGLIGFRPWA